jgi:drug/metabolite transporter (DMT)-like permease
MDMAEQRHLGTTSGSTWSTNANYLTGAAFGLSAALIWAGWSVLTRFAVRADLDAWDIGALRFGVAGLLLFPVVMRRGFALDRLGWVGLATIVTGLGAPYVLMAASGLKFAPASDQGALNPGCMPLFVAAITGTLLGERFSISRRLGLSLVLAGAAIIVVSHAFGGQSKAGVRLATAYFFWRRFCPHASLS